MKGFGNPKKDNFLASIPDASFDLPSDTITKRCKFNFSYFDNQNGEKGFDTWDQAKLAAFINKLKDFGRESLAHWQSVKVGKSGTILALYGAFPAKSTFSHPKHVPHQAVWGRFRLDWAGRLCGFVIPNAYDGKLHDACGFRFDCNTFYVVFIDEHHEFYQGKEAK